MAKKTRNSLQKEVDRCFIAEHKLKGLRISEIARLPEMQHISPEQVRLDLKKIEGEWRKESKVFIDEEKKKTLATIDVVMREAFLGYQASKDSQLKRIYTGLPTKDNLEKSIIENNVTGDPRFLSIVLSCIERKCKILKLDAPQEISVLQEPIGIQFIASEN